MQTGRGGGEVGGEKGAAENGGGGEAPPAHGVRRRRTRLRVRRGGSEAAARGFAARCLQFAAVGRSPRCARRRKLHIPRPSASVGARSFRCSSSPHKVHGLCGTLCAHPPAALRAAGMAAAPLPSRASPVHCHRFPLLNAVKCRPAQTEAQAM